MKLRTLVLAVLLLAAASAVAWWFNRPATVASADPRIGRPFLDPSTAGRAAVLRVSDHGKTAVVGRAGAGWEDRSYFDAPADFSKLGTFVDDLTSATLQRMVTSNPARIARLEFGQSRVELLDASGRLLWSADFGKTSDSGGRFVRYGGESRVYLASTSPWLDTDPKAWADADLLNLKAEDVRSVEISFAAGPDLVLSRAKAGDPWSPAAPYLDRKAQDDQVSSLLSNFTSLRFTDTVAAGDPPAAAARAAARRVRLRTFGGAEYTVLIGRPPPPPPPPGSFSVTSDGPGGKPSAAQKKAAESFAKKLGDALAAAAAAKAPPGPVFVFVSGSGPKAPAEDFESRRACITDDYVLTSLPKAPGDLLQPPPPAPRH